MKRQDRPPSRPDHAGIETRPDLSGIAAMAGSSGSRDREFELSAADFERIRKLIYDHAGISLAPAKQDMVYSRLTRRLRACGDRSFAQYLSRVERDGVEWEAFVNALTTNLTSFFREAHHFETLAGRLRSLGTSRTINIWCCAASTGEEPYSLAITACEAFRSLAPPVSIIASDVNTSVLAHAQRASYSPDRVARMPAAQVQQFFTRESSPAGEMLTVRPELKKLINFRPINLLESNWGVQSGLDAIFCRNVMIYFDKQTQYAILKRFVPLLRLDGSMFAGHSESFLHASDLFRPMGRTVYQRADHA